MTAVSKFEFELGETCVVYAQETTVSSIGRECVLAMTLVGASRSFTREDHFYSAPRRASAVRIDIFQALKVFDISIYNHRHSSERRASSLR